MSRAVYGGVEGGGTKFNCVIGTGPDDIVATETFPTTDPEATLGRVVRFFRGRLGDNTLRALGMASFGPVDLDRASPTYGHITTTPKAGWQFVDVAGILQAQLGVAIGFDTDVTAATLGEHRWGAAQDVETVVYVTIGTGIGSGHYVNGAPLHGLIHPETGHLLLPPIEGDDFPGVCPFHRRCFEGMCSGPALGARLGRPAKAIAPDHPVWELEARYIAMAITSIMYVASPHRIVLGGGVMEQLHLFPRIRRHVLEITNSYLHHTAVLEHIDSYIVPPGLGPRAGMLGAIELARLALES